MSTTAVVRSRWQSWSTMTPMGSKCCTDCALTPGLASGYMAAIITTFKRLRYASLQAQCLQLCGAPRRHGHAAARCMNCMLVVLTGTALFPESCLPVPALTAQSQSSSHEIDTRQI